MSEEDAFTILDALDLAAREIRDHRAETGVPLHVWEQMREERLDRIQAARLTVRELRGSK